MTDNKTWKSCKGCGNGFSFNNEMAFVTFEYCPQCVAKNPLLQSTPLKPTAPDMARRRIAIYRRIELLAITKENKERKREMKKDARRGSFMDFRGATLHGSRKYYFKTVFHSGDEFNGVIEPGAMPPKGARPEIWQEFNREILRAAKASAVNAYLKKYSRLIDEAPTVEFMNNAETLIADKIYSGQFVTMQFIEARPFPAVLAFSPIAPEPVKTIEVLFCWSPIAQKYIFLKIQ